MMKKLRRTKKKLKAPTLEIGDVSLGPFGHVCLYLLVVDYERSQELLSLLQQLLELRRILLAF